MIILSMDLLRMLPLGKHQRLSMGYIDILKSSPYHSIGATPPRARTVTFTILVNLVRHPKRRRSLI